MVTTIDSFLSTGPLTKSLDAFWQFGAASLLQDVFVLTKFEDDTKSLRRHVGYRRCV